MTDGKGVEPEWRSSAPEHEVTDTPPASVDWLTGTCVNPVTDQGACGSCWAFAATAGVESSWCIDGNPLLKLSEQQVNSCANEPTYKNSGCNGGLAFYAWEYLVSNG